MINVFFHMKTYDIIVLNFDLTFNVWTNVYHENIWKQFFKLEIT